MAVKQWNLTLNFDSGIDNVVFNYGSNEHIFSTSGEKYTVGYQPGSNVILTVTLKMGYTLNTAVNDGVIAIGTINGNVVTIPEPESGFNYTWTLTSKQATSKVSIDLTTLSGWDNVTSGEHTIQVIAKASGYLDSEKSTAVTFTKAVINPTYQVLQGTLPQSALSISSDNKNDLPTTTNQTVKTVFDNYNTMNFSDILSTLLVDTSVLKQDQYKNEVDLTKCEKLTDTCSIFFVKDGNKKYYDYTDNINLEVVNINSSNLTEANLDNTYCVVIEVDTGKLNLFSFSSINNATGNITTKGDNILGVAFLISKKQNVLLEAGTYQFIETLKSNTELDIAEPINCKVNTLTSNDTYGDISESGVFNISVINTESNPLELDIASETIEAEIVYQDNSWVYMSSSGNYTTTDTSKLRTIVLETDQYVSQEFYDWAITQGNLAKVEQSTGETWVLNDNLNTAKALEKTEINFTSNNIQYTALQYKRGTLSYYTVDGSLIDIANPLPEPEGTSWVYPACKTITFETAPTGDLLTWLQANGTKQGETAAHTLSWSDSTMLVTVNGNSATSPYTLANGDKIVLKRTSGYQSYNIITNTGSVDTDTISPPLTVINSDIKLQNGNIDMSPSVHMGFTINYTEDANSGGNIQ